MNLIESATPLVEQLRALKLKLQIAIQKKQSMTQIEQLHLEAIDNAEFIAAYAPIPLIEKSVAAKKSAEITEQIACEFVEWLDDNSYCWNWYYKKYTKYRKILPIAESDLKTTKQLFQEYLKSKENEQNKQG